MCLDVLFFTNANIGQSIIGEMLQVPYLDILL